MFQPHSFEGQAASLSTATSDPERSRFTPRGVLLGIDAGGHRAMLAEVAGAAGFDLTLVEPDQAATWMERRIGAVDMVWVGASDRVDDDLLEHAARFVASAGARMAIAASPVTLDAIFARVEAWRDVDILVDPDPAACLLSLARAGGRSRPVLNDPARTATDERIDHLQGEVERIVQMLAMLRAPDAVIAHSHGATGLHGGFDDAMIGYGVLPAREMDVRSPSRGFHAAPAVGRGHGGARVDGAFVRQMIRQRRLRDRFFPADIFADPAWDMMLDLFAARLERRTVSVSSLCIAAAVPATTALRWIKSLTDAGIFVRESDPQDGRRIFVALADSAEASMRAYCAALEAA